MKTRLIDLLVEVVEPIAEDLDIDAIEIGNKLVDTLDDDRRIEICFYSTYAANTYDALSFSLISKTHGCIDKSIVKFSDLFESIRDLKHPNKIGKHIWLDNGSYSWYGKPTKEDQRAMQEVIENYYKLWR